MVQRAAPPLDEPRHREDQPNRFRQHVPLLFDNKTSSHKEWRARALLYGKKMAIQGKNKGATINLLTSLSGLAWRQIEHEAEREDGFPQALAKLGAAFKYDARVEAPRSMEQYFFTDGWKPDQTILSYVSEHRSKNTASSFLRPSVTRSGRRSSKVWRSKTE